MVKKLAPRFPLKSKTKTLFPLGSIKGTSSASRTRVPHFNTITRVRFVLALIGSLWNLLLLSLFRIIPSVLVFRHSVENRSILLLINYFMTFSQKLAL